MRPLASAMILWAAAACSPQQGKSPSLPPAERPAQQQPVAAMPGHGLQAPFVLDIEAPGATAAGGLAEVRVRLRFQGGLIAPLRLSAAPGPGVAMVEGGGEERIDPAPGETVERTLRLRIEDPAAELRVSAEMRGEGFGATARRVVFFDGRPPLDPGDARLPPREGNELVPLPAGKLTPLTPIVPAPPSEAITR